jgi:riboflavin kinase / FMN adenylyltransferase
VFLFHFDGDLYGRDIDVEFIDFIRPDLRFEGVEELRAQMEKDCERAREILRQAPAEPPITAP